MNKRSLFFIALILPAMFLLSGCIRKKDLLLKLSTGMTKNEVESKLGKPDEIHCPIVNSKGDVIDIWEYSLATVDEIKANRRLGVTIGCLLLFPPLAFIPAACMESEFSYDTYFLKFINNFLSQWGRRSDIELPSKNNINIEK